MQKRVLLSSVFKPFGVDNLYSRTESKIELYHNQLSKAQGIYSPRALTDSYGLHAIGKNVEAPITVLDYPTLDRFKKELKKDYDIVGIGSILPNFQKAKKMVEVTREMSPRSKVILGGFCAALPDVEKKMDVDHICIGDGISFMRKLLNLPPDYKFQNPDIYSDNTEILGVPLSGIHHPLIIVGLGCSYGCDFCSPSHFFNRRHIKFYTTGQELLDEMIRVEKKYGSNRICLTGDDNFLIDLKRADELRKCVIESGQAFDLLIFGSADLAIKFGPERLAEMGVGTIWIGRESMFADYRKNKNTNIRELVAELKNYGIDTILSSILLLDQHTRENIEEDINDHLACQPSFSQFAFYAPLPGTPLYDRMVKENRILTAIPFEEWHAFKQPWFVHPEFDLQEAEKVQNRAYDRDFYELGPSIMRAIDTDHRGWQNLKDSQKPHLRARADYFASRMKTYKILLLAMEHLVPTQHMKELVIEVRKKIEASFGKSNLLDKAAARAIFVAGRIRETRTRFFGDTLQPRTRVVHYNGAH